VSESDSIEHSGLDGGPIPVCRIERHIVDPQDLDGVTADPAEFSQTVSSRRLYSADVEHLDGLELPLGTKPTWTLTHLLPDGSQAPTSLAVIETSVNGRTCRLIAGPQPGTVIVDVSANVSATSHAATRFKVLIKPHPPTPTLLKFKIASHRDAPIH
jgi:hypothetical protein